MRTRNIRKRDIRQVLVVDDHPVVARGIRDIVSEFPTVTCVDSVHDIKAWPALFIVDLELGEDGNGFDYIDDLRASRPGARVLVYTMHEEPWVKARLRHMNVDGAVSKNEPLTTLRYAIATMLGGARYFSPVFALPEDGAKPAAGSDLSSRERDVARYLCAGLTSDQIADEMGLSINTVNTYRRRVMDKLHVQSVAQLVCQTKGLV